MAGVLASSSLSSHEPSKPRLHNGSDGALDDAGAGAGAETATGAADGARAGDFSYTGNGKNISKRYRNLTTSLRDGVAARAAADARAFPAGGAPKPKAALAGAKTGVLLQ